MREEIVGDSRVVFPEWWRGALNLMVCGGKFFQNPKSPDKMKNQEPVCRIDCMEGRPARRPVTGFGTQLLLTGTELIRPLLGSPGSVV